MAASSDLFKRVAAAQASNFSAGDCLEPLVLSLWINENYGFFGSLRARIVFHDAITKRVEF